MGSSQSQPILAEVATQLPSAILERAAEIVGKPNAWTQGSFGLRKPIKIDELREDTPRWVDDATCFCALGSIAAAKGANPEVIAVWDTPEAAFLNAALPGFFNIPAWNDRYGRTQAEVVAKLREAAALARDLGQ